MSVEIEAYTLAWSPKAGSAYRVKIKGGAWSNWFNIPSSELAGVAAILRESPVYAKPDGSLATTPEQVGQ